MHAADFFKHWSIPAISPSFPVSFSSSPLW
jgi:hypothetical protein